MTGKYLVLVAGLLCFAADAKAQTPYYPCYEHYGCGGQWGVRRDSYWGYRVGSSYCRDARWNEACIDRRTRRYNYGGREYRPNVFGW